MQLSRRALGDNIDNTPAKKHEWKFHGNGLQFCGLDLSGCRANATYSAVIITAPSCPPGVAQHAQHAQRPRHKHVLRKMQSSSEDVLHKAAAAWCRPWRAFEDLRLRYYPYEPLWTPRLAIFGLASYLTLVGFTVTASWNTVMHLNGSLTISQSGIVIWPKWDNHLVNTLQWKHGSLSLIIVYDQ